MWSADFYCLNIYLLPSLAFITTSYFCYLCRTPFRYKSLTSATTNNKSVSHILLVRSQMFRGSKGLHRCDRRFWSLDCFLIVDDTHKKGRVSENSSVCMMKEFQLGRSLCYCSVLCKTAYRMLPRGCVNEIILEAGTTCHLHIELA